MDFFDEPENKDRLNKKLSGLTHFNRISVECELTRPIDRSKFVAEMSFVGLEMDYQFVIQVHINDITDKVQNAEKFKKNTESFRSILDYSPATIFIFTDNQPVYQNSNAESLRNEQLNNGSEELLEIFPNKHHHLLDELLKEANSQISSYNQIENYRKKLNAMRLRKKN